MPAGRREGRLISAEEARDWLRSNAVTPTRLQEALITSLDQQEVLCAQCRLGVPTSMLCSGLRPVFNGEESAFYETLRIVDRPCEKLDARVSAKDLQGRLHDLMIPPQAVDAAIAKGLPEASRGPDGGILLDGEPIPVLASGTSNVRLTQALFAAAVAMAHAGITAKFVYPQTWYAEKRRWDELGFDDIHVADWVYVERLDAKGGTDYSRSEMFSAIQQRVASGLPTAVTLGPAASGRNEVETALIQEVQTWQRMTTSLSR